MNSTQCFGARFLGVGNAGSALGNASCVIERDSRPLLMIDCGYDALSNYLTRYAALPPAIFITHLHLDHIGGLENLFFRLRFASQPSTCRLYVPAVLIPHLQKRIADYPGTLAEGGANFWDAFHLIPVGSDFWHESLHFKVFPTRHHLPNSSFGLALPGAFLFTGDTRPVPEQIVALASAGEIIFHDCGIDANPSHTGLSDLEREYSLDQRRRMVLYHYATAEHAAEIRRAGYRPAQPGELIELKAPHQTSESTSTVSPD